MKHIAIDVMSFEAGELSARESVELFATLIKSGLVWNLQGWYGRQAEWFLETGLISREGEIDEEIYAELVDEDEDEDEREGELVTT
ncbi:hypothetical protein ACFYZ0_02480 [Streptomyces sp. NPDC001708]|uniref:DUF7417 domain-containing protein n=1 Tax=Streptomyces sp. NPDC001708 TaxID=3364602 RepID=UPI00368AA96E